VDHVTEIGADAERFLNGNYGQPPKRLSCMHL